MDPLAAEIIEAHGGLERWRQLRSISAHLTQAGALWEIKGRAGVLADTRVTVSLTEQWASHAPFGDPSRRSEYTPGRVALVSSEGQELETLEGPRASFDGHTLETPWTDLQLAYFAGLAMWTYLNVPYVLALPGVRSAEIAPWMEEGSTWRRLQIRFPDHITTHSSDQTLYVDATGLIRRHDYDVEIAGGTPGAHYLSGYRHRGGLAFATSRRIYPRQHDGTPQRDMLVVSIDLDHLELS
ncbi:hypothetical protein [Sphingomonas sp. BK069]|uniref:hypothetical protein n=1 Tax=Sphingomonas sp. BK069 TaxID=2586979 RepID=UPI001622D349|nr:hypothetical protein [Sphingomonas sp. BK069]MBB3348312.1 hypothetical protein [Sphingomonas sp. BK069]